MSDHLNITALLTGMNGVGLIALIIATGFVLYGIGCVGVKVISTCWPERGC